VFIKSCHYSCFEVQLNSFFNSTYIFKSYSLTVHFNMNLVSAIFCLELFLSVTSSSPNCAHLFLVPLRH
jgi:hypothetical protein